VRGARTARWLPCLTLAAGVLRFSIVA